MLANFISFKDFAWLLLETGCCYHLVVFYNHEIDLLHTYPRVLGKNIATNTFVESLSLLQWHSI